MANEKFVFPDMTDALLVYLAHKATLSEAERSGETKAWFEVEKSLRLALPEGLLRRYDQAHLVWLCRDATRQGPIEEATSPSGRYRLQLSHHECGNTKARVLCEGQVVAEVCRNYGMFPHLFIENHPNGHPYLVCGEDYQGQTVVELDTGRRRDELPPEADEGHAFCWAMHQFDEKSQILMVDGCHWGCPYEFRFYDFSDPMAGWPPIIARAQEKELCDLARIDLAEINADDVAAGEPLKELLYFIESDTLWPVIEGDRITTFQSKPGPDMEILSKTEFRREGNVLAFVRQWVSEAEAEERRQRDEAHAKRRAWEAEFMASDPLYLAYQRHIGSDPGLRPGEYESYGETHKDWCPEFKGNETRWCRDLVEPRRGKPLRVQLEWAVLTGPIKLIVSQGGRRANLFFEHSVSGMNRAFEKVQALLEEESRSTEAKNS